MPAELAPYFVGFSSKMYFGRADTLAWLEQARRELDSRPELTEYGISPFVAPPFPLLVEAQRILSGSPAILAAQSVSWGEGALTGEVSAALLAEVGVRIVEIGHAERRAHFGETAEIIRRKVAAAVASGIRPLLCVGEPTACGPVEAARHCSAQVDEAGAPDIPGLIVAYEPVWAIGAQAPADDIYISEVVASLRESVRAPIIYGGSAKPGLVARIPHTDGVFLGRFAHDPRSFGQILDEAIALHRSSTNARSFTTR